MWGWNRREQGHGPYAEISNPDEISRPERIGRFRLEDQILGGHGKQLWRAYDEVLKRIVVLRLVDPQDPLHDDLRAAACSAARAVNRGVVQVLDVLDFDGTLVIVTEWVDAIPLEQLLTSAMTPEQSVEITRRVAEAVGSIHEAGLTHGRIRPACVMIDNDGEVRLRGHMIDARIYGIDPGNDPTAADLSNLGAIMTACLTGRWPGNTPTALPSVPLVGGKRAIPSQLRADIPARLDSFVIRCMAAVPGPATLPASNSFSSATSALEGLTGLYEGSGSLQRLAGRTRASAGTTAHPRIRDRASKTVRRTALVAVALAAIFGAGFAGARLFPPGPDLNSAVGQAPSSGGEGPAISIAESRAASGGLPPGEQVLPISAAMVMLPNAKGLAVGQPANAAIDADPATSWQTPRYNNSTLSTQQAGGIIVDLGQVRQVKAVNIGLVGNNSSVELRAAERLSKQPLKYQLLQKVKGASTNITLREVRPLATRYLLILLTSVPETTRDKYQGGISSIQIRG